MNLENTKIITYPDVTFKQEYRVDKEGKIYSPWRGWHEMYQSTNKDGYKGIYLYTNEKGRKGFKVHRLVLEAFDSVENSSNLEVNHIDGNKENNSLNNLEWCTRSENLKHAFRLGLENTEGEKNPAHKLTEKEVIEICELLIQKKYTYEQIGNMYGVTKGAISRIKNKRGWKKVTQNYDFS